MPSARVVAESDVEQVVACLRGGGLVVLPTDTVYGLAALPTVAGATGAIFTAKGRAADVPLAVLCADADMAWRQAAPIPPAAWSLGQRHWPGPLTVVVPRRPGLDWDLGDPADTVGLRCPDHDLIRAVASAVGPIAVTSANRHGEPTPTTAVAAAESLVVAPDLVVDGGELIGASSTVVDCTGPEPRVLRAGPIEI